MVLSAFDSSIHLLPSWPRASLALGRQARRAGDRQSALPERRELANPANDAAAVTAMLKSAGFDRSNSKLNLTATEIRKTLREFAGKIRDADVAMVYYAGHGIELDGTNYLIPDRRQAGNRQRRPDETLPLDRVLTRSSRQNTCGW